MGVLKQTATDKEQVTYGRAAKCLAVYLKVTVILAGHHDSPFGKHLHPPVDRMLLKALAEAQCFPADRRKLWGGTNWTQLTEDSYFELINSFRDAGLADPAFWMIERYWDKEQI